MLNRGSGEAGDLVPLLSLPSSAADRLLFASMRRKADDDVLTSRSAQQTAAAVRIGVGRRADGYLPALRCSRRQARDARVVSPQVLRPGAAFSPAPVLARKDGNDREPRLGKLIGLLHSIG